MKNRVKSEVVHGRFPYLSVTVRVTVRWTHFFWNFSSRIALIFSLRNLYLLGLLICLFPALPFVGVLGIEEFILNRIRIFA